jgi:cytosine/adenosine deaminase-related metal-dependent hydrolase
VLLHPIHNIVSSLVHVGSGHEVVTVMVAGEVLVANADRVRAEAQVQAEEAAWRVARIQCTETWRCWKR